VANVGVLGVSFDCSIVQKRKPIEFENTYFCRAKTETEIQ